MLLIGSNIIINCFKKLPYKEEFGTKHLVWMTLPLLVGTCLCPIALVGGAIVARAAAYTVGIVGGLWYQQKLSLILCVYYYMNKEIHSNLFLNRSFHSCFLCSQ